VNKQKAGDAPIELLNCLPIDDFSSRDVVRFVDAHYLVQHASSSRIHEAAKRLDLDEVDVEEYSLLARSFAKLRVNSESFFHQASERLQKEGKMSPLSGKQIVDLVYAFAKFNHTEKTHGILYDLLVLEAKDKLHTLTIDELTQLLSSFARAHVPAKVIVSRALSRFKAGSEWWIDSTFENIVNLTMAFGKFQIYDLRLLEALSSALIYHFTQGPKDPSSFSISNLINIIHGLAKVHLRPPDELLAILTRELTARVDEIEIAEAIKYIHAAGKIHLSGDLSALIVSRFDKEAVSHLSLFDALKIHLAVQRLDGVESSALEAHLLEVLPYDLRRKQPACSTKRKPAVEPVKNRKSARKRKWTW